MDRKGYQIFSYDVMAIDQFTKTEYVCETGSVNTHFIFPSLTPGHFYRFMFKPIYKRIF